MFEEVSSAKIMGRIPLVRRFYDCAFVFFVRLYCIWAVRQGVGRYRTGICKQALIENTERYFRAFDCDCWILHNGTRTFRSKGN